MARCFVFKLVWLVIFGLSAQCFAGQESGISRLLLGPLAEASTAQITNKPAIMIVARGADSVLGDIKLLFDLAKASKEHQELTGTLDIFLTGVDRSRGFVITGTVVKAGGDLSLTNSVPVSNQKTFTDFRNALKDLGMASRPVAGAAGVYQVVDKNAPWRGFLRFDESSKSVLLSADRKNVQGRFNPPDAKILGADGIVVDIDNTQQSPKDRQQTFAKIRKEVLGPMKAQAGEDPKDFAIRKQTLEQASNELERFFVESERIRLALTTDSKLKQTKINVELKAIAGSSLAQSIDLAGKTPDAYASSAISGAAASLFLNFPMDAMRKTHLRDFVKLARPRAKERIAASTKLTDQQKKTDTEISEILFDVLEGIGGLDTVNGYMQMAPNKTNVYTVVGSAQLANGNKFANGIAALAKQDQKLKLNVAVAGKGGTVKIHALNVAEQAARYPQIFGKDATLFIGASDKAMWYSTGENALKALQDAVDQAETAGAKPTIYMLKLDARLYPFIEVLDIYRKAHPRAIPAAPPAPGKAPRKPKPEGELRRLALETFMGGRDMLHLSITGKNQAVTVEVRFEEGLLTFFGKVAAKFVRENLM